MKPKEETDWEQVYIDFLPRVFHYFWYKTRDVYLAEDLTSTTFEKIWRSRKQFDPTRGRMERWIFRSARNIFIDYLRSKTSDLEIREKVIPNNTEDNPECVSLVFSEVLSVLAKLPAREQELISLKYGAELTNREISKLTGISESNVGTILHRTIGILREKWTENE